MRGREHIYVRQCSSESFCCYAILIVVLLQSATPSSQQGSQSTRPMDAATISESDALVRDLTHRAQVDFQSSNYSAARSKLRKALDISPRDPALWNYLGLTDEQLGDLDSAITDFSRALSFMPGYAPAYFNLGRLYQRGKQIDRALAMYRQGLLSAPDDLTANQNYALLLMTVGHFRDAISPLRKLSILDKTDSSIRATLIECYLKAALPDEASKEIQNFLREPEASVEDKLN